MQLARFTLPLFFLAACQPQTVEKPAPAAGPAATVMREIALVANAEDATVSLFDVAARKVVATIDINPDKVVVQRPGAPNYAQDTDISPDGHVLYVSRGYMGDVAAFDIASGKQLWVRKLDSGRADHMTITPDGKSLFVSVLFDNQVEKIDAATGEARGRFGTGVFPHDNQISADGKHVYNTSLGQIGNLQNTPGVAPPKEKPENEREFTIADIDTLSVTSRIAMPVGIRPWHMKPDGTGFYAPAIKHSCVSRLRLPVGQGNKATGASDQAWCHGGRLGFRGAAPWSRVVPRRTDPMLGRACVRLCSAGESP